MCFWFFGAYRIGVLIHSFADFLRNSHKNVEFGISHIQRNDFAHFSFLYEERTRNVNNTAHAHGNTY